MAMLIKLASTLLHIHVLLNYLLLEAAINYLNQIVGQYV